MDSTNEVSNKRKRRSSQSSGESSDSDDNADDNYFKLKLNVSILNIFQKPEANK